MVRSNAGGINYLFKKYGVVSLQGWGRLAGGRTVEVAEAEDGSVRRLEAKRGLILATGSECKPLPFIEMDGEITVDSTDILDFERIPERLVVLGAGAVGTEFASIFHRYGSHVTLVELLPHVLPLEDEDVSAELAKAFKKSGIDVYTDTRVQEVERRDGGVTIRAIDRAEETIELVADQLLVATGRRPNTEDVGIDKTRIALDEQGFVQVDEYLRTEEPGVYAVGDVIPTAMLAHLGSHEGILAVDHILGRPAHPIRADRVPNCTYCDPEVASVGLTEREARNRGYEVKVGTFPFAANGKAKILNETTGFVKLVGESRYDEVLGVHIIGPKATEMIAEWVVALQQEVTAEEVMHSIHPHPTLTEAMGEAAHALFFGTPIHY
jgi:dihydrolipoamide dehydrogenase